MLILLSLFALVAADTYVWQQSSNWGNPQNWQQERMPCAAETAILSAHRTSTRVSKTRKFEVTLDVNQTLKSLRLAPGGRMRLQLGTHLKLSPKTSCKEDGLPSVTNDSINHFKGVQLHPWNCVDNWKRKSDGKTASKVPCGSDVVSFPSGKSVSWIRLQSDVKVSKLEWMGKAVSAFSDIPNSGIYFVKTKSSAGLTVDPRCLLSQPSLCHCYQSNCSIYPTPPAPVETTDSVHVRPSTQRLHSSTFQATQSKQSSETANTLKPISVISVPAQHTVTCPPNSTSCSNSEETQDSNTDFPTQPIIIGISCGGAIVIVAVIVIICLVYRKRYSNLPVSNSEYTETAATKHELSMSSPTSKQSFTNPAFQDHDPTVYNPIYADTDDVLADNSQIQLALCTFDSIVLVFLSLYMFVSVDADTFVWRHSSNWANPTNWNQARLPCAAETVKLARPNTAASVPLGQKFEVRVDVNVTLKKLVLPRGSSLKLNKNVRLILSKKADCREVGLPAVSDSSMNEFIGVQPHNWNCANNWERLSDKMRAVRVPCESDTVQFQSGKSYSWITLNSNVKVAGIQWQGNPVHSLSEIPKSGTYFVKAKPSADLTANPTCTTSPSACPCLSNDCSLYPTSPLPPTAKAMMTTATAKGTGTTTKAVTKGPATKESGSQTSSTTVSGTTKVAPSPCAPGDDPCIKIISGKGTDTESSSHEIWPVIVGVLVGVVGLLVVVVVVLVVVRRKRTIVYEKEEVVGTPNAVYSSHYEDPKVDLSFENPMYAENKSGQIYDNAIYDTADAEMFQNVAEGSSENLHQKFDEDGLPI
ncbi:uncharacterized protein LOC134192407 [Corticium candelabrum]|uniref:uncharacterized protein LOC134192407 n=1 Tax=Corticium candelabrum TaxID=121492 RepID=UPI002E2637F9|nr:uncharacterized protein LOC134192407 [Corticium candelabrum]